MNNGRLAFFNLVKEMRAAQKEYFRTRAHSVLARLIRNLVRKIKRKQENYDDL